MIRLYICWLKFCVRLICARSTHELARVILRASCDNEAEFARVMLSMQAKAPPAGEREG